MKPEDAPKPEELAPAGESIPEEPALPDDFTPIGDISSLPRARRRRAQRMLIPPGASERAALLEGLARRAFPSLEFFLFALLCGAVIGVGYLLNSPALLLLGILIAPLLTPWVGLALAVLTGSWRFFLQTLAGLTVAAALVFLTGVLAGLAGRLWAPLELFYANVQTHLWWPDLLVVTLGAALMAVAFTHSEQKPLLPSILLAYGFFLPLNAAGVGLGIGALRIWPDGVLVFLIHLALATLVGGITLAVMRFRPVRASGYALPVLIALLVLYPLIGWTGLTTIIRNGITDARYHAPTPVVLPSLTAGAPQTPTSTASRAPSATASLSPTPEPTASYAVIGAETGGGATVRSEPGGGSVITILLNGYVVQVLPEIQTVGTTPWVRVRLADSTEGWVLQSVLHAATLTPTFTPGLTLTPTQTPTP